MKLEKKSLREAEEWKKAGYELPEYDLDRHPYQYR